MTFMCLFYSKIKQIFCDVKAGTCSCTKTKDMEHAEGKLSRLLSTLIKQNIVGRLIWRCNR